MNKVLIAIVVMIAMNGQADARQGRGGGQRMHQAKERIHAANIAYLTDRLQLTAEQAARFVPVYNEYELEIKAVRRTFLKRYKGVDIDSADEETARRYIDDNLEYQQQTLDIKRRYNDRFLKVLTPQQLSGLPAAEREFRQILMQRMKERRDNRARKGNW